jgi:hypothetical protein
MSHYSTSGKARAMIPKYFPMISYGDFYAVILFLALLMQELFVFAVSSDFQSSPEKIY